MSKATKPPLDDVQRIELDLPRTKKARGGVRPGSKRTHPLPDSLPVHPFRDPGHEGIEGTGDGGAELPGGGGFGGTGDGGAHATGDGGAEAQRKGRG